jgi:DNA-binding CsgD family transcriptional regulator
MVTKNPILTVEEKNTLILGALHPNLKHLSNSEIGERLGVSETRVKMIIHSACTKLGADNKNEAVLLAMKRGEIIMTELLSLEELAEILNSCDPDVIRKIAKLARDSEQGLDPRGIKEDINCMDRIQNGILTNRERDVLILSRYGLTNNEIADKLYMTTDAVRTFLNRAFKKLGASKKADAIQLALKRREISICEISSLEELVELLVPMGADKVDRLAQILEEKYWQIPIQK